MAQPVIKVSNLTKKAGKKIIIDELNLEIQKGEIFGIIGPSGSGKTTLLKLMVGFLIPDAGSVHFETNNVFKLVHSNMALAKRAFGFVAQEPSFYLQLKVKENLDHFGSLYGLTKQERAENTERLLKLVGLYENRENLAIKLSGGMRRRLGLVTSTIHNPSIYVLDEPTADLDPSSRGQIIELIRRVKEEHKTVIIASHLLEDIELLCDRVAVLNEGKIQLVGTPEDIKKNLKMKKIIELKTKQKNYNPLIKALSDSDVKINYNKLVIKTKDVESALLKIFEVIKETSQNLDDITISKPSLDKAFAELVKND